MISQLYDIPTVVCMIPVDSDNAHSVTWISYSSYLSSFDMRVQRVTPIYHSTMKTENTDITEFQI